MKYNYLNKFILVKLTNEDWSHTYLRRITRDLPTMVASDVQRTGKDWKEDPIRKVRVWSWAAKFKKDGKGGIKQPGPSRWNRTLKTTPILCSEDLRETICPYTFEQIFDMDVRSLDEKDYTRKSKEIMADLLKEDGHVVPETWFSLIRGIVNRSEEKRQKIGGEKSFSNWDDKIINYLEKLFGVDIFLTQSYHYEQSSTHALHTSGTIFQITHFGDKKKYLIGNEDYDNRTIIFWNFGDKVVIHYAEGLNCW